ncbi:R3H domain protein [Clostridiales bacterium CHKCI006]|uniref:KH domain-containing protein n=1 Tax=Candidatus Fimiplasma intestinipullorum TaxID=2840825 RepID=A0A9D1HQ65_9FIRM|nr:R3H domain protein [Clostridiales bacterium CHKCI006]HIU13454.1 KH domain-containing protein [Candidatus Fimiplasma intestinipullorum]
MNKYTAKTLDDALEQAANDMQVAKEEVIYTVVYEKKTLFTKRVEIEAYCMKTIQDFIVNYVQTILSDMGFENEVMTRYEEGRIYVDINSDNNSILIGKGGVILRAINTLVKTAVSNTYKRRVDLTVDINGYKQDRYKKVASMAMRLGRNVQRNRVDVKLDPMPGDERKVIHQTLANMNYVRTESTGEGKNRYLTIIYDPNKKKNTVHEQEN